MNLKMTLLYACVKKKEKEKENWTATFNFENNTFFKVRKLNKRPPQKRRQRMSYNGWKVDGETLKIKLPTLIGKKKLKNFAKKKILILRPEKKKRSAVISGNRFPPEHVSRHLKKGNIEVFPLTTIFDRQSTFFPFL